MSDTTACSNCGASVPSAAKFCTTCGQAMAGDATNIDQPRPDSPTQVQPAAAPAWAPPGGGSDAAGSQPWAPADATHAPAAGTNPPQAPAWGQAPGAQTQSQAPTWQQPPAAPPGGQPAWAQPPGEAPAWGQTPMAVPTAKTTGSGSPLGGIVALLGGVLTLIGIFTAWVGAKGGDSLTGWDLTSGDKIIKSNDPYILLVLAIVALAIGIARFTGAMAPIARVAGIVVGVAIIGIMIRDWLSIVDVVKTLSSDVRVNQKFGYFLAIAGGGLVAVSALMPSAKKAS